MWLKPYLTNLIARALFSIFICSFLLVSSNLTALAADSKLVTDQKKDEKTDEKNIEPPKIGNFILPSSQQPGSFLSFGQNIYDKGVFQTVLLTSYLKGASSYYTDTVPSLLYCPTDSSSILMTIPVALGYKIDNDRSRGLNDISFQYEQSFYTKSTSTFTDLATIVANVSVPSGSVSKNPSIGYGAPSYFLGIAFLREYPDWLAFTSQGILIPTAHHGTKFGNDYFYQFGIGRNIFDIDNDWIFAWILEATGQYAKKNKFAGFIDDSSGGNIVFLTPSIWISSKNFLFQFGVGKPIVQHLFGTQNKIHYLIAANISLTFY